MVFKIVWSGFAEIQLDEIYEYYEKNASAKKKLQKRLEDKFR